MTTQPDAGELLAVTQEGLATAADLFENELVRPEWRAEFRADFTAGKLTNTERAALTAIARTLSRQSPPSGADVLTDEQIDRAAKRLWEAFEGFGHGTAEQVWADRENEDEELRRNRIAEVEEMRSFVRIVLAALATGHRPADVGSETAREALEIVAKMPCETIGPEDMEGGCCAPCRARAALSPDQTRLGQGVEEASSTEAVCIIPNCGRRAPAAEPFCSKHREG